MREDRVGGDRREAAGTAPERVLVTCVHQHGVPIADLEAERLLQRQKSKGSNRDLDKFAGALQGAVRSARLVRGS